MERARKRSWVPAASGRLRPGSFALATGVLTGMLPGGAALADEPSGEPEPACRGDACAEVSPRSRAPLMVAVDPALAPPPPPARRRRPRNAMWKQSDAAGPRISFGRAISPSLSDAWYGRVDTEYFEVFRPGMLSIRLGLEGWGSPDGGGGGIPWAFEGGAAVPFTQRPKSPRFVTALGLGWEWAYYDRVKHVGQFGIFAPLANAYLGVDFRGVRLFGEGSAQYRWGWGGPDRAQYRIGASLSLDSELWDGARD